ncbi:hypothetical protein ACT7DJ_28305 [Bacillus cereus]
MDMRPQVSGVYQKGFRHTVNTTNNFYAVAPIDDTGSATWANQFSLNGTTGVFDVKDINVRVGSASNVVTTLKDGRATLTLTVDASNWNTNRPPIATRRGNTVTLRGAISLVAGYAGANITTLPTSMRPIDSFTIDINASDGTSHAVSVFSSGEISFGATAKGKQFNFMTTYVVD